MSQHIFNTTVDDQNCEVQIGWDRPMQNYYFVISPVLVIDDVEELDDPIDSNLHRAKPFSLVEIMAHMEDKGIVLPEGLVDAVRTDRINNACGEIHYYPSV